MSRKFMGEAPLMEKKSFIKEGEPTLASYDWTDVADGTGYIEFDGFAVTDSVATTRHLSSRPLGSNGTSIQFSTSGTYTYDFDLTAFNTPRYVQGTALIRYSRRGQNLSTGQHTVQETITIQHYDGTTATSLGSVSSPSQNPLSNAGFTRTELLRVALTPKQFKRGDILRVHLSIAFSTTTNTRYAFAHDPLNADISIADTDNIIAANNPTQFKIQIPFRIDI
jgi:hypothetical protein